MNRVADCMCVCRYRFDPLEYAATFSSEQCPEGICAISGNLLRIISCERLGEVCVSVSVRLSVTCCGAHSVCVVHRC